MSEEVHSRSDGFREVDDECEEGYQTEYCKLWNTRLHRHLVRHLTIYHNLLGITHDEGFYPCMMNVPFDAVVLESCRRYWCRAGLQVPWKIKTDEIPNCSVVKATISGT